MVTFSTNTKLEMATVPDGLTDLGHLIKQLTSRTQHQSFDMDSEPTLTKSPVCTETVPIPASADALSMSHPAVDDVAHAEEDLEAGDERTPKHGVAHLEDDPDEENMSTSRRSV